MAKCSYTADEQSHHLSRRQWLKTVAMGAAAAAVAPILGKAHAEPVADAALVSAPSSPSLTGEPSKGRVAKLQPVPCTECDRCMPCGYGVDIPGNFKVYNDMLAAGDVPDVVDASSGGGDFASKARKFIKVYDRSIADRHQAQRCARCFHCVSECREHIAIVNELSDLTHLTDVLRDYLATH